MNWMQRATTRRHSAEDGLTLIELMIVILILGILAAIIVLGIGAFQDTGEEQACTTSAKSIESAAAAYYTKNDQDWPTVAQLVEQGFVKEAPKADWDIAVDEDTGDVTDNCEGTPAP